MPSITAVDALLKTAKYQKLKRTNYGGAFAPPAFLTFFAMFALNLKPRPLGEVAPSATERAVLFCNFGVSALLLFFPLSVSFADSSPEVGALVTSNTIRKGLFRFTSLGLLWAPTLTMWNVFITISGLLKILTYLGPSRTPVPTNLIEINPYFSKGYECKFTK